MGFLSNWLIKSDSDSEEQTEESKILSRWSLFGMVFLGALITVLYVDNVMRVDGFLEEVQKFKKTKLFLQNENEMLRTRLNELQSPERITKIAEENLGMIKMESPPEIFPEY